MKIAILGTENSHALAFARLIHQKPEKYADLQIVGIYGYDEDANRQILSEGLAPAALARPEDLVGSVDGILVTARHGDLHWEYALPYIQAGIPSFIDKPFTVDLKKTDSLLAEAAAHGTLLCGGSSLKFLQEMQPLATFARANTVMGGYVAAPINMQNAYGGFFFYAQHLTEILVSVFGASVRRVFARCPDETKNRLSVVFSYDSFDVLGQYSDSYAYTATVLCKEGACSATARDVAYCYEYELDEFAAMLRTGVMPRSYESLAYPSRLLSCMYQSYKEGREVVVPW